MISVFDYLDYRKFLRDYYEERHAHNKRFSHRFIAKEIGFDSGYFAKISKGERHISAKLIPGFIKTFELNKQEASYFKILVQFSKAKIHTKKTELLNSLLTLGSRLDKNLLSASQFKLFDNWYNLVIREILAFYNFSGDYKELASMVVPKIKPSEAKQAIKLLEELELIKLNNQNIYERVNPIWSTGEKAIHLGVINFHKAMADLAKDAFDNFSREEREMSTLTLSISEDDYHMMVKELSLVREKFLKSAADCKNPDRVYHLNVSLFPVSNLPKGGAG